MFEIFQSKQYLLIVGLAVLVYLLLWLNPATLQRSNFAKNGSNTPDPAWIALIVLVIGTVFHFLLAKNYL